MQPPVKVTTPSAGRGVFSGATRPRRPRRGRGLLLFVLLVAAAVALLVWFGPAILLRMDGLRWFLTDDTPPIVVITAPTSPVRGVVTATILVQDQGPATLESVLLDNRPLTNTATLVIDTAALPDGSHELVAEARDLSRQRNAARASARLLTENQPPSLQVALDPPLVPQGQTLVVRLTLSKAGTLTATLDGLPLTLSTNGDTSAWGLVGIGADARLITHTLAFTAGDRLGNTGRFTSTFGVTVTNFVTENIELPPDRQGLSNTTDQAAHLAAAFATLTPSPMWQGVFRVPAPGEQTAPFGEARSYNGGPLASWHGGVDLAAPAGAPVGAAAAGRVVLAEKMTVQGNTVVVDHGLGLASAYYHMSSLAVKVGDKVAAGQTLGYVGNTGLSTGPHLHWEMRILGVPVDPWQWTRRAVP